MNPLVIDFETRSPLDLRKVGIYKYVDDTRTTILCFHISCGDNSGTFFDPTWGNLPGWAQWALDDDAVDIHAHNATVERLLIQRICHKRHGWPLVDTGRFRCSATRAARLALPRALEKVGAALGLETQKDKEGTRIMRRLSRPIKTGPDGFVYDNDPEKLSALATIASGTWRPRSRWRPAYSSCHRRKRRFTSLPSASMTEASGWMCPSCKGSCGAQMSAWWI
jgi:hypothetical protein